METKYMNHIYDQPQFGEDWFTYKNLYSRFVREMSDGSKIVEVGCWKGKSVSYLAVEIINSGKKIQIDAIDWGNQGLNGEMTTSGVLWDIFMANIQPLRSVITPYRLTSVQGSKMYADSSLDVVFVDACHLYDSVINDIDAWLPKVKSGGYLAGHDWALGDVERAVKDRLTGFELTEGDFYQGTPWPSWVYKKP